MAAKKFREMEAAFWIAAGASICYLAYRAHFGTFHEPGPGFVPFFAGAFILVMGLVMLVSRLLSQAADDDSSRLAALKNIRLAKLGYTVGLLVAYGVLLSRLGYVVTTFLLMWALLYDSEKRNRIGSLLSSIVIVASSYIVFEVWLQSQLPRGIFPWW